jgi:hypothetical protein
MPQLQPVLLVNDDQGIADGEGINLPLDTGSPPTFIAGNIATLASGVAVRAAAGNNTNLVLATERSVDPYFKPDTKLFAPGTTTKNQATFQRLANRRVVISTAPGTALLAGDINNATAFRLGFDATSGQHFCDQTSTTNGVLFIERVLDADAFGKYVAPGGVELVNPGLQASGVAREFGAVGETGVRVVARFSAASVYGG